MERPSGALMSQCPPLHRYDTGHSYWYHLGTLRCPQGGKAFPSLLGHMRGGLQSQILEEARRGTLKCPCFLYPHATDWAVLAKGSPAPPLAPRVHTSTHRNFGFWAGSGVAVIWSAGVKCDVGQLEKPP